MENSDKIKVMSLIGIALALQGCAVIPALRCGSPSSPYTSDTLYFGAETPHGSVSSQQWGDFLAAQVTTRFPQGLTVWPASGQWQAKDGTITHEASYVLSLIHPNNSRDDQSVRQIVAAYESQFQQESVLRVQSQVCVSF